MPGRNLHKLTHRPNSVGGSSAKKTCAWPNNSAGSSPLKLSRFRTLDGVPNRMPTCLSQELINQLVASIRDLPFFEACSVRLMLLPGSPASFNLKKHPKSSTTSSNRIGTTCSIVSNNTSSKVSSRRMRTISQDHHPEASSFANFLPPHLELGRA